MDASRNGIHSRRQAAALIVAAVLAMADRADAAAQAAGASSPALTRFAFDGAVLLWAPLLALLLLMVLALAGAVLLERRAARVAAMQPEAAPARLPLPARRRAHAVPVRSTWPLPGSPVPLAIRDVRPASLNPASLRNPRMRTLL